MQRLRGIKGRAADAVASIFIRLCGLGSANAWSTRVAQRLSELSRWAGDDRKYELVSTNPLLLWRAKTFLSKEPETIAWIRGFARDDVLYDIGANIGVFSLYAASRCRRVYAFEPEAANFAILNRNIERNGLSGHITAYPLAIADAGRLDTLRLSRVQAGAAHHSFGSNVNFKREPFTPAFTQGSIAVTLDELIERYGMEVPNHVKLDVDGLEAAILQGGQRLLRDQRLKSVLVEINELDPADAEIADLLKACGLIRTARGEAISDAAGSYSMRNCVFSRP